VKIAVVGAGAIGGYVGGWLAAAGEEVTFIARGANLAAIKQNGMRVIGEDGTEVVARPAAFERAAEAGPQDFVVLAVKAHQVAAIAADVAALCHGETAIVTMQNGIPWWYFHKHGGPLEGTAVRSADPDGSIAKLIDADRVIGRLSRRDARSAGCRARRRRKALHARRARRIDVGARAGHLGRVRACRLQGPGDRRHSQ
jgi:2-dehydropantoate 2-reductase